MSEMVISRQQRIVAAIKSSLKDVPANFAVINYGLMGGFSLVVLGCLITMLGIAALTVIQVTLIPMNLIAVDLGVFIWIMLLSTLLVSNNFMFGNSLLEFAETVVMVAFLSTGVFLYGQDIASNSNYTLSTFMGLIAIYYIVRTLLAEPLLTWLEKSRIEGAARIADDEKALEDKEHNARLARLEKEKQRLMAILNCLYPNKKLTKAQISSVVGKLPRGDLWALRLSGKVSTKQANGERYYKLEQKGVAHLWKTPEWLHPNQPE